MKTLCVLQHVEAEYLGLIEDHLESRTIRFSYCRPFVPGGRVPADPGGYDGLIVLGAGPLGAVSGSLLPSLGPELRLVAAFLERGLPVVGLGLGAVILSVAAGGGAAEAPLRFTVGSARRTAPAALGGHLPDRFPVAVYMRDRPALPPGTAILAETGTGEPAVFRIGGNAFGFLGHPGVKSGMIEDLVMEFDETPEDIAETLASLRFAQAGIAEALTAIMVGLVKETGWMALSSGG